MKLTKRIMTHDVLGIAAEERRRIIAEVADFNAKNDRDGEGVGITGICESTLIRPDGSGIHQVQANLITNAGFDFIADVLGKPAQPSELSHIGIGTGSRAAAAGDAALQSQTARVAAAYAHDAGTKVFTLESVFPAGTGTGNIREVAAFNAAAGGTMFNRIVFAAGDAVNKTAEDSLRETLTFTLRA